MKNRNPEIQLTAGEGFSSAANSRSSANRNALNSKKTPYKKAPVGGKSDDIEFSFIKPSQEELEKAKSQINNEIKKNTKEGVDYFCFCCIDFCGHGVFFF